MKAKKVGNCAAKNGASTNKGTYGHVYKGRLEDKTEGTVSVAVKEYVLPSQQGNDEVRSMVEEALGYLLEDMEESLIPIAPHPNLARYYGIEYIPGITDANLDRVMLTVDWIEHDKKLKGPLPEEQVRAAMRDVTKGLAHLHAAGFSHDDMRPCNIIVTDAWKRRAAGEAADAPHAVLTDYAIFKKIQDVLDPEGGGATTKQKPSFLAPEVFTDGKDYDSLKADVWSLGCCALELLSGKSPWHELDPTGKGNVMFKIISARSPPKYPDGVSAACKNFLDCCFTRDFGNRPSSALLAGHDWFKQ